MNLTVFHTIEENVLLKLTSYRGPTLHHLAFAPPLWWVSFSWFTDKETVRELGNLLKVTHLKSGKGGI